MLVIQVEVAGAVTSRPAPLYRADISIRGVPVPAGAHTVRFDYDPPGLARGQAISIVALALLVGWSGMAYFAKPGWR